MSPTFLFPPKLAAHQFTWKFVCLFYEYILLGLASALSLPDSGLMILAVVAGC